MLVPRCRRRRLKRFRRMKTPAPRDVSPTDEIVDMGKTPPVTAASLPVTGYNGPLAHAQPDVWLGHIAGH